MYATFGIRPLRQRRGNASSIFSGHYVLIAISPDRKNCTGIFFFSQSTGKCRAIGLRRKALCLIVAMPCWQLRYAAGKNDPWALGALRCIAEYPPSSPPF